MVVALLCLVQLLQPEAVLQAHPAVPAQQQRLGADGNLDPAGDAYRVLDVLDVSHSTSI